MALAATLLTGNYDNVDRTSYTTASISPAANSSILLFYFTRHATTAPDLTPSGVSGITWTQVVTQLDGISRIGCWHGAVSGSPGTGALTLTIAGGVTAIGCSWSIVQVTGQDTSGTIVQSPVGATGSTGTSSSVTFSAAAAADNRFFSYHFHRANEASTPRTNWTELDDRNGTAPNVGAELQWRNDGTNETTGSASWTTSSRWQALGVEVKNLAAGGSVTLEATSGNGGSTTTADLAVAIAFEATSGNGLSSTAADLVLSLSLEATSGNGLSSTSADMILSLVLASSDANGLSGTLAELSNLIGLEGSSAGVASTLADLIVGMLVELAGDSAGVSTVTGDLSFAEREFRVVMIVGPGTYRLGRKQV